MHWHQRHLRTFKGQQSPSSGNPFGRWSGGAVIHAWQLQEGQWHSQDNTAVPSAPGCHNHPWSNSPLEYYGRVTQASDTGDIHHSREQAYRHELPNTNTPLCLLSFPPPLPAVIPHDPIIPKHQPWSELGTAQSHSWEQGHPAHALSCTAQISHCMDPVAGLLPEKTASHKVLNGFHYYFSCRILLVAVLGRSLCLDTVLLISGYFHPVFDQTWSHTTPQHHPEQPGTTNAHQKIQKYIY